MNCPLRIADELRRSVEPGAPVLLALSGGVDSATSLAVLRYLGCEVTAVTFKNYCHAGEDGDGAGGPGPSRAAAGRACCSLDAIADARRLADRFGARHWVHDVSPRFRAEVVEPFIAEYAAARTPNPCLDCNAAVRFPELLRLADMLGCRHVATGHYARTRRNGEGKVELLRGLDPVKDQSYFLSRVAASTWERVVFPLGWSTKTEVRSAARALGLSAAERPESQEICFLPDGDRGRFFTPVQTDGPGPIVDSGGSVLGRHRGLIHYTVGQRRGLGIAHTVPLYVLALDAARNSLVVGPLPQLAVRRLHCDRFVPAVDRLPAAGPVPGAGPCVARVRHRHAGARVAQWSMTDDTLVVDLAEPVYGAAPGQGLTLYEGDRVLGGGRLLPPPAAALANAEG